MFRKLILASSIACLAVPAVALAEPASETFVHDGVTYAYTVLNRGERRIFRGTADGKPFRLVVSSDRVSGTFNSNPVQFRMREVVKLDVNPQVAAR